MEQGFNNDDNGSERVRRHSSMRVEKLEKYKCFRCFKQTMRSLSVGEHTHGLYYNKRQKYLSIFSGIFTIFGVFLILAVAIKVLVDTFQQKNITSKIELVSFSLTESGYKLSDVITQTGFNFKIKAMSYNSILRTPLFCDQFVFKLDYVLQYDSDPHVFVTDCVEINGVVKFYIRQEDWQKNVPIDNSQFFRLHINYTGDPLLIEDTQLFLLYYGSNYYFTGTVYQQIAFTSLDLPFGSFYKTQIQPIKYQYLDNLWQLGIFGSIEYNTQYLFQYTEPYFETANPGYNDQQFLIYFKYSNDNNPYTLGTATPDTILSGLQKIGGYITFIGIFKLFLILFNRLRFEKSLKKNYERTLQAKKIIKADQTVDPQQVKDDLSYEMLIRLIIEYQKKKKKEAESRAPSDLDQKFSTNYHKATYNNVTEEDPKMIFDKKE